MMNDNWAWFDFVVGRKGYPEAILSAGEDGVAVSTNFSGGNGPFTVSISSADIPPEPIFFEDGNWIGIDAEKGVWICGTSASGEVETASRSLLEVCDHVASRMILEGREPSRRSHRKTELVRHIALSACGRLLLKAFDGPGNLDPVVVIVEPCGGATNTHHIKLSQLVLWRRQLSMLEVSGMEARFTPKMWQMSKHAYSTAPFSVVRSVALGGAALAFPSSRHVMLDEVIEALMRGVVTNSRMMSNGAFLLGIIDDSVPVVAIPVSLSPESDIFSWLASSQKVNEEYNDWEGLAIESAESLARQAVFGKGGERTISVLKQIAPAAIATNL